jgi:steroid delta-isomerase-like uncharacterized protein
MSRDDIAALMDRRHRAWNAHDAHALSLDHSEDCVVWSPLAGGSATGREALERLYTTYFHAFTDFKLEQRDLLIDGDRAALFAEAGGTDRGGFMGTDPTGRAVKVAVVFLYQLRDGLIVSEHRIYDFTGLLIQIGMLKAKPS